MKRITLTMLTLLLLAGGGLAQRMNVESTRLQQTSYSKRFYISGRAMRVEFRESELFAVQVRSNMPDGTELLVLVNTEDQERLYIVGRIMLLSGFGELRMSSGPFGGQLLGSPMSIKKVCLEESGVIIAEGSF